MSEHLNVMVSSTVLDLPSHRKAVKDACLQQNMFPIMMECLPSTDTDAIQASIDLVNRADIYIGVFRSVARLSCSLPLHGGSPSFSEVRPR